MAQPKGGTTMGIVKIKYKNKKKQQVIYYCAEVYVKGVRIARKSFSTRREAVLWHENKKHKFTLSPSSLNDKISLKECISRFWTDVQDRTLKSTYQSYQFSLENYLNRSPLANMKMSEIKGTHIVEWVQWLKRHKTAKNKRRKSFFKELSLLKNILNWYKDFLNEDFNVPITKKHKKMCVFKSNAPRRPDYFIKPDDARKWIEWLKNRSNPVYWRLASFMLLTGTRVGEACGMKWSAIDLDRGVARIIRRVRWDQFTKFPFLEEITKTSQSTRIIVLPKKLTDILLEMKQSAVNDLVFTDKNGSLLKYNAVQLSFNQGFTALGLPWRSTHICRHTYATIALMETKNILAVQASLGHREIKMTQRYAKTIALLNSEVGEKTASAIFKDS